MHWSEVEFTLNKLVNSCLYSFEIFNLSTKPIATSVVKYVIAIEGCLPTMQLISNIHISLARAIVANIKTLHKNADSALKN